MKELQFRDLGFLLTDEQKKRMAFILKEDWEGVKECLAEFGLWVLNAFLEDGKRVNIIIDHEFIHACDLGGNLLCPPQKYEDSMLMMTQFIKKVLEEREKKWEKTT